MSQAVCDARPPATPNDIDDYWSYPFELPWNLSLPCVFDASQRILIVLGFRDKRAIYQPLNTFPRLISLNEYCTPLLLQCHQDDDDAPIQTLVPANILVLDRFQRLVLQLLLLFLVLDVHHIRKLVISFISSHRMSNCHDSSGIVADCSSIACNWVFLSVNYFTSCFPHDPGMTKVNPNCWNNVQCEYSVFTYFSLPSSVPSHRSRTLSVKPTLAPHHVGHYSSN